MVTPTVDAMASGRDLLSELRMIRILAAFVVLFAGALACVSLLPTPSHTAQPRSAVAMQLKHEAEAAVPQPKVRVVYPAPNAEAPLQQEPMSPAVVGTAPTTEAPAVAAAPAPTGGETAAIYPQTQGAASADAAQVAPVNQAAQAGTPSLNLNTASVDALNQIPGAGRIGRTIASHRPYRSVEDLLTKRVVRKSVYDRIKDQVAAE